MTTLNPLLIWPEEDGTIRSDWTLADLAVEIVSYDMAMPRWVYFLDTETGLTKNAEPGLNALIAEVRECHVN